MTPDFKRGVEAARVTKSWYTTDAMGNVYGGFSSADEAAGYCSRSSGLTPWESVTTRRRIDAPTPDPAAVSEVDEADVAHYRRLFMRERETNDGSIAWGIRAVVATVRAERAPTGHYTCDRCMVAAPADTIERLCRRCVDERAPDLAALRAAVHDYRTGWAVQADNAFPGPVDRIIAAARALVATPPAATAGEVGPAFCEHGYRDGECGRCGWCGGTGNAPDDEPQEPAEAVGCDCGSETGLSHAVDCPARPAMQEPAEAGPCPGRYELASGFTHCILAAGHDTDHMDARGGMWGRTTDEEGGRHG